jgi:hypothetical protein
LRVALANTHCNGNCNGDRDGNCNGDGNCYRVAEVYANAKAASHTAASSVKACI